MNWRFGICTLLYAFSASCGNVHLAVAVPLSADSGDENIISLVGTGCEDVRGDDTRSSVRIRATDKASFNAVEKIPELSGYRDSFSSHDFNVLVYNIIDNYIEDQTVRTTSQDDSRLCVEMTGYLNSENILKVLNDNFQKYAEPGVVSADTPPNVRYSNEDYPDSLQLEGKAAATPPAPILPPPPQPVISDKVAARPAADKTDLFADAVPETSFKTVPAAGQPAEQLPKTASNSPAPAADPAADEDNIVYIFVDKTRFYNNTATLKFYQDLKQAIEERNGIKVTLDKEQAAYTVKTRVLRAKVDPINQQTSRLQMVIAAELEQPGKESVVEHQNRFVLFDDKEDEQTVAANLMRKLLLQATRTVLKKVKLPRSDAIITPAETNYGVFDPTLQL